MTLVEWPLASRSPQSSSSVGVVWLAAGGAHAVGGGIESSELPCAAVLASWPAWRSAWLVAFVVDARRSRRAGIQNLPPGFRYGARLRDELSLARPFWTAPLLVVGSPRGNGGASAIPRCSAWSCGHGWAGRSSS